MKIDLWGFFSVDRWSFQIGEFGRKLEKRYAGFIAIQFCQKRLKVALWVIFLTIFGDFVGKYLHRYLLILRKEIHPLETSYYELKELALFNSKYRSIMSLCFHFHRMHFFQKNSCVKRAKLELVYLPLQLRTIVLFSKKMAFIIIYKAKERVSFYDTINLRKKNNSTLKPIPNCCFCVPIRRIK